ncbi:MAG TPA: response regulator [Candidatus Acidoferrum sp.]|nr:response regulator [Candidatus Acidoferrum sp.]
MAAETILVADDDQIVAQLLSSSLRAHGFNVVLAFDAMQAMMAIRRSQPAAVVLDILMPAGSGVEVLKRLRSFSGMAPTHVLAVSASPDPQLPDRVKELGAGAFLRKPLDPEEVYRVLCTLLGKPAGPKPEASAASD